MRSPAGIRQVLTTKAEQVVGRVGSSNVKNAKFVQSNRNVALARHQGTEVDSKQAVYVVQVNGTFSKLGKSGESINGSVVEVVVDAATGEVTDWGITGGAQPLDSLGVPELLG